MQYRNLIKIVIGGWMYSLLLAFAVPSFADDKVVMQQMPDNVFQLAESGSNPWALPEVDEKSKYYLFRGQPAPEAGHQGTRFVTPEILESLKQQQRMYQQSPSQARESRPYPRQALPSQIVPTPPVYGYSVPGSSMYRAPSPEKYGMPLDGMSYSNPMVDVPSVSPWGNTSDLLQRGGSFPWMPDAAVGGLPPIHIQPFADQQDAGDTKGFYEEPVNPRPNNVFNPFSFGPNGNL